jgi:hypothetical protein
MESFRSRRLTRLPRPEKDNLSSPHRSRYENVEGNSTGVGSGDGSVLMAARHRILGSDWSLCNLSGG